MKRLGCFIDDVTRKRPALVKRNRDLIAVLSLDLMDYILSEYKFTVVAGRGGRRIIFRSF